MEIVIDDEVEDIVISYHTTELSSDEAQYIANLAVAEIARRYSLLK